MAEPVDGVAQTVPIRLAHNTIVTSTPAGNRNTHGNVVTDLVPSAISVPSDTSGGCTPKPRKLSSGFGQDGQSDIQRGVDDQDGGDVRQDVPGDDPPAGHTHISCGRRIGRGSRRLNVIPRTIRELTIQLNSESSTISSTLPVCLTRGSAIAIRMKLGTTKSRSTTHINARSRQPPKYPATDPTVRRSTVDISATHGPMRIDFLHAAQRHREQVLPQRVGAEPVRRAGGCCSARSRSVYDHGSSDGSA